MISCTSFTSAIVTDCYILGSTTKITNIYLAMLLPNKDMALQEIIFLVTTKVSTKSSNLCHYYQY